MHENLQKKRCVGHILNNESNFSFIKYFRAISREFLGLIGLVACNKTIIWGALDVSRSRVETKDEVVNRISKVLEHIDRERLVISPDCGLGLLDTSIAMKKLKIMCESVSII